MKLGVTRIKLLVPTEGDGVSGQIVVNFPVFTKYQRSSKKNMILPIPRLTTCSDADTTQIII